MQDRSKWVIGSWERGEDGKRIYREFQNLYYFYVPDKNGDKLTIDNVKVKKLEFSRKADLEEALMMHPKRYESDLSPLEKCMTDYYGGKAAPKLNIGLFDIEVDYDPKIGFAGPKNPYAPINAITVWLAHLEQLVTVCVPPPEFTGELIGDNIFVVGSERELLETFFGFIDDLDVISGWNSDFFDMPYLGKRIEMLFGDRGMKRLSFPEAPNPRWTEKLKFKGSLDTEEILEIYGRVHLDYMALFRKFNLTTRQSFALNAVASEEIGEKKLEYDGSLSELYHQDFQKFIDYNRHDTVIMIKLDEKFKYIELANQMVHEATVNFGSIFGSVQLIDTAIINYAHRVLKRVVWDKEHLAGEKVEGALVMSPVIGMHEWIASCDINSLYPSTYRSLNLSPEKIMGQLVEREVGWRAVYDRDDAKELTLQLEGSETVKITAGALRDLLISNNYALSAYGTILDQGNGEGLLPAVLSFWFNDRKKMQAEKKRLAKLADERLTEVGDKQDPEYLKLKSQSDYCDMLQGVKKVLLNSSYGATLNEFCRFHDPRLGASTTGSGRQITTFMIEKIAELTIGPDHPKVVKKTYFDNKGEQQNEYTIASPKGLGPLYSDTDSCYFSVAQLTQGDEAVGLADGIVENLNNAFPEFMQKAFFCKPGFDDKIRAVRELVVERGIFRAKKKYMLLVFDSEGKRIDRNDDKAFKTQGSDIKLSSTPDVIKKLLKDVTLDVLRGHTYQVVSDYILNFRESIDLAKTPDLNPLDFGTVTSVRTLTEYQGKWELIEKTGRGRVTMPANVRSAINYNATIELLGILDAQPITPGAKVRMLWLKPNEHNFTTFAFPVEVEKLPEWFTSRFQIDLKLTEKKLIDKKIDNIFAPIGWQVPTRQTAIFNSLVSFE